MIEIGDYIEFDTSSLVLKLLKNDQVLVLVSPHNKPGYTFSCSSRIIINQGGKKVTDQNKINIYNKLAIFQ